MSDQDDTLLDEDLGDEEYDLGNDEEEALLADDYEIDRQNSYKGEEETDDVLDLGVTDALDDLDAEDDNNDNTYINVSNNCYANDQHHDNYYNQNDNINYNDENTHHHHHHHHHQYENNISSHGGGVGGAGVGDYGGHNNMHHVTPDLREKLKKTIPRDVIVGNGQGMEDDDCDEARERRNRFQNERTVISPKMNNEIPDSLENVVTVDQPRMSFRGRGGRGRGIRGGGRGARFPGPNMGNFNPRYPVQMQFEDQNLKFRAPLIETRPQIFPNAPSNQMNPQLIYRQDNPHIIPQFQQFNPQGVSPHPRSHFNEPRPQFNPNQFHPQSPQVLLQQPRHQNPQMEYIPRGPMQQAPPRYNGPQNPQFIQNQRFQRPPHENELSVRPMGNRLSMMAHQGPLNNMPRQQMPGQRGPPPPPQMHQGPPRHPGMPVSRHDGQMPVFRQPIPNQMPQIQHNRPPGQQVFENRQQFQQENRSIYEQRQFDNRPLPVIQFNNQGQQVAHHPTGPSVVPAVPNVPLASGHKILINPHFRGNVQPPQEARSPTWEGSQPPSHQQQLPNEQFASQSAQYQGQQQASYSQQLATQSGAQGSNDYPKKYPQNNKNDDPYAYFSDVWQENKTSKSSRSSTPPKSYSGDNNYSRDSNYRDYEKYKSEGRDNYQASKDQRGRDRSPQSRPRDHQSQRSRPPSTNNHDSYDQRSRLQNSSNRPPLKPPQKRTPEPHDRSNRGSSPKRSKNHRNFHEARSTTTHNSNNIKKEEDMDPEMRDYRKKMEEQKRLREKILQEKENRRKQAALDKQVDESKNTKNTDTQQENKSLGSSFKKDDVDSQNQSTNRSAGTTEDKNETGGRVVTRTDKNISDDTTAKKSSYTEALVRQIPPGTRRVVIHKTRVATSNPSLKNHSNNDSDMTNEKLTEITKIVKKLPLGVQKKKTIKKIVNEQSDGGRKILLNDSTSGNATTAHSNRVVLQKPIQIKRTIDNKTNIVIVENISSKTNETKLREMCKGIGAVESVIISDNIKSATIVFKTHSAAMVFHKKYQKKIIDQSVINIRLVSQAGTLSSVISQ